MIAVVFALEFEAAEFVSDSSRRMCLDVWQLGMTGERAVLPLQAKLEKQRPTLVVSAGFSGGLSSEAGIGDVFIAENQTTPALLMLLPSLRRANLVTVDEVLATAEKKARVRAATGAQIVDMETEHFAKLCAASRIPFLSLRAVSDTCDEDLPLPGDVLIDRRTGRAAPDLVFRYLLKNPRAANGLSRLVRNSKLARKRLSAGLNEVLPVLLRNPLHRAD